MAVNTQFITQPGRGVIDILLARMGPSAKKTIGVLDFSAVGLVQGKLLDMMAAADVAEKAADVQVFDLKGTCPQHLTMIGIFGDIAAVRTALDAVTNAD